MAGPLYIGHRNPRPAPMTHDEKIASMYEALQGAGMLPAKAWAALQEMLRGRPRPRSPYLNPPRVPPRG